jgi:predicted Zn-dependent protease
MPMCRRQENEADAIAMRLLARTGIYEPQHMIDALSRYDLHISRLAVLY